VSGVALPRPVAERPVGLGGLVAMPPTDGELVTAIVEPSRRRAHGYPPEVVSAGGLSPMGDFSDALTVRDLVDLVAFLHRRYEVQPAQMP
jgi:hypothetical protein